MNPEYAQLEARIEAIEEALFGPNLDPIFEAKLRAKFLELPSNHPGTSGQTLESQGTGFAPEWVT